MTRFLAFVALALLPLLARGEGYICVADMATGFVYRNGEWRETSFKSDEKFIVRSATDGDRVVMWMSGTPNAKWVVAKIGDKVATFMCPNDFDSAERLYCGAGFTMDQSTAEFRMNKNSLRFVRAYLAGYWNSIPGDEAGDTPLISIGKCSPM